MSRSEAAREALGRARAADAREREGGLGEGSEGHIKEEPAREEPHECAREPPLRARARREPEQLGLPPHVAHRKGARPRRAGASAMRAVAKQLPPSYGPRLERMSIGKRACMRAPGGEGGPLDSR